VYRQVTFGTLDPATPTLPKSETSEPELLLSWLDGFTEDELDAANVRLIDFLLERCADSKIRRPRWMEDYSNHIFIGGFDSDKGTPTSLSKAQQETRSIDNLDLMFPFRKNKGGRYDVKICIQVSTPFYLEESMSPPLQLTPPPPPQQSLTLREKTTPSPRKATNNNLRTSTPIKQEPTLWTAKPVDPKNPPELFDLTTPTNARRVHTESRQEDGDDSAATILRNTLLFGDLLQSPPCSGNSFSALLNSQSIKSERATTAASEAMTSISEGDNNSSSLASLSGTSLEPPSHHDLRSTDQDQEPAGKSAGKNKGKSSKTKRKRLSVEASDRQTRQGGRRD